MHEATAWIIDLGNGLHAALGYSELEHLVPNPTLFEMPLTPRYCRHLILWEGDVVPVLDLALWLTGEARVHREAFAALIGYEGQPGDAPQRGALMTTAFPERVRVCDSQACDLPPEPCGWSHVACSCFRHENQPIPVLDLPFLFSEAADLAKYIHGGAPPRRCDSALAVNEFIARQGNYS